MKKALIIISFLGLSFLAYAAVSGDQIDASAQTTVASSDNANCEIEAVKSCCSVKKDAK